MAAEKIAPVKIDGRIYNIPLSKFYTIKYKFNKLIQVGSPHMLICLWKIDWKEGVKATAPNLQFKIGWENGPLNDESNMRPHNSLNIYWIFKGFFINSEPLLISLKDNAIAVHGKQYSLSLALVEPSALPRYAQ